MPSLDLFKLPMVVFHVHTSVAEDVVGDAGGVDDSDVAGDLEKARNAESVAAAAMVEERVYFHISVHKASWQIMLAASWVMLAALLDVEDVEDDLGPAGCRREMALGQTEPNNDLFILALP